MITFSKHSKERIKTRVKGTQQDVINDILTKLKKGLFYVSIDARYFYVNGKLARYVLSPDLELITVYSKTGYVCGHYEPVDEELGKTILEVFQKGQGMKNTMYFLTSKSQAS